MRRLLLLLMFVMTEMCRGQSAVVLKSAIAPHYPPLAVAARIAGHVTVRIAIDARGDVVRAEAITGPHALKQASEEAAKQWKFQLVTGGQRKADLEFVYVLLPETKEAEYEVSFSPPLGVTVEKHPPVESVNYGATPGSDSGVRPKTVCRTQDPPTP